MKNKIKLIDSAFPNQELYYDREALIAPVILFMSKKRQVEEAVSSEAVKKVKISSVEDALKLIKKKLSALPSISGLDLSAALAWCKKRKIVFPWPTGKAPVDSSILSDLTFDFEAPQSVAVAGSFMLQSVLADGNVDLIAEMPDGKIFRLANGAKDHINWKYWLRRSFYLAVMQVSLKDVLSGASISTEFLNENPFKPVICIKIEGVERVIRVIPSLPWSEAFQSKIFRLAPQRSNVRAAWIAAYLGTSVAAKEVPTPVYNASLLSEALYVPHLVHLHECFSSSPALAAALKLMKAWLRNVKCTAMTGFVASMWLAELVKTEVVSPSLLDELQIFKIVLKSWSEAFHGCLDLPFSKRLTGFAEETSFAGVEASFEHGALALIAGPMNLLFSASQADMTFLAAQADSTLAFLRLHPDRLDRIFLASSLQGVDRFCDDLVISFELLSEESSALAAYLPAGTFANWAEVVESGFLLQRIELVLRKGLTDRLNAPVRVIRDGKRLRLGLSLDPLRAERVIDLGPTADQGAEAAKFRGFWGSRAELRQFKDTSIRECVAWEAEAAAKKSIPSAIVAWLLERHFGVKQVKSTARELSFAKDLLQASNEFSQFTVAFDALARELRGLGSSGRIPLGIVACLGLSSAHAQTCAQIPKPIKSLPERADPHALLNAPSCPVYGFLIQFEKSSAWPAERQALQAARQAFLLQLHRVMRSNGRECLVGMNFIDILQDGFVFRGWLEVPREALRCRVEGLNSEAESIERRTFWQPRLIASIKQLAMRQASFAPTCRLIKSFLSGQLIDFPDLDELVDVICAAVFLGMDQRGSALAGSAVSLLKTRLPGSPRSGFLRVLDLLATFPFTERPLVLDFTCLREEVTGSAGIEDEAKYTTEETQFMATADWSILTNSRISSAAASLHVIPIFTSEQKAMLTNALDSSASALSILIPVLPMARLDRGLLVRLRLLGRLTLESISTAELGEEEADWSGLFGFNAVAIKSDYDLLIKLDPDQLQLFPTRIDGLRKMLQNAGQPSPLLYSQLPGFSAAATLVAELRSALTRFEGVAIAWNKKNPKIICLRVRKLEYLAAVEEIITSVGGDMILETKRTQ